MPVYFPPLDHKLQHQTQEQKAYCKRFFEVWDDFLEEQRIKEGRPPLDETSNNIYSSRLEPRERTGNPGNLEKMITIYVYHHEYEDGPHLPAKFTVNHIYDDTFKFYEYPRLVKLLDCRQYDTDFWNHDEGEWEPLDPVGGCKSVDYSCTGEFLIIRRADHPSGSNSNLIGFAELVRELDFVAGRQYQPTALSPDNLCPTDWDVNVTEKDWVSYGKDYPISDSDSD